MRSGRAPPPQSATRQEDMDDMDNLDKLDLAILHELQKDGRVTVTELASRVGLSKTPCQIRMRRLEEQGYILGYIALIDQKKIGSRWSSLKSTISLQHVQKTHS